MKLLKIGLFLLTLLLLMTIYHFSDRTATESNQDSTRILVMLRLATPADIENNTPQYQRLHSTIRIFAHFTLYALLALSLYLLLFIGTRRISVATVISFIFIVAWAVLDEKHQILVEGRSFELFDIYVDAFGGLITLTSATTASLVHKLVVHKKLRKGSR